MFKDIFVPAWNSRLFARLLGDLKAVSSGSAEKVLRAVAMFFERMAG